jgi:3-dehydro-4-phosphotetronate decarboxylase
MSLERDLRSKLIEAGKYMLANGLAWGSAGNISARLDKERCLISASGTNLGRLEEDDLVAADITVKSDEKYARRPSKELPMHAAVYSERPEINAVLHGAPFYTTLISCTNDEVPSNWFVEAMYYLERVARVPYHHPGSQTLADAVKEKTGMANILLLENHGVLVYDVNLQEALQTLHTLEVVCAMLSAAGQSGIEINPLSNEVVNDFLENSGYRPRRQWKSGWPLDGPSGGDSRKEAV